MGQAQVWKLVRGLHKAVLEMCLLVETTQIPTTGRLNKEKWGPYFAQNIIQL